MKLRKVWGFKEKLKNTLKNTNDYRTFKSAFLKVLSKHAALKKKLEKLSWKGHFKDKTQENLFSKKKYKNFCNKLYEKERKKYYNSIDNKHITDSTIFWKSVQPFQTDQVTIQF